MKILLIACLLVSATLTHNLDDFTSTMSQKEGPFDRKEFNLLLLLDNAEHSLKLNSIDLSKITETTVHQSDIVAKAVEHHTNLGGEEADAYVMSHDLDTKRSFNHLSLGFEHLRGSPKPYRYHRAGRDYIYVDHRTLENCINSNHLGVTFTSSEENAETIIISFNNQKFESSLQDFDKSGLLGFFTDLCKIVELSKRQLRDYKRNTFIIEIQKVSQLLKGKYAELATQVLDNTIAQVTKHAIKAFGEDMINLLGVQYNPHPTITQGTRRHLEETVIKVQTHSNGEKTASSIRYCFSVVLLFIYLIICVNLYQMEIYKDSLVFSNFLTSKKVD